MRRVNLSRPARADVRAIMSNIGQDSPRSARRFLFAVVKLAERLTGIPELGPLYELDHPDLAGLRVFPVPRFKKYLLFYRIHDDEIEVVRVIHGARDIPAILEG